MVGQVKWTFRMNLPSFGQNLSAKIKELNPALKAGEHSIWMPIGFSPQIMNPETKGPLSGFLF